MSAQANVASAAPALADYLLVVMPHLRGALLSEESRTRLAWMAARLPVCSDAVLEFRLVAGAHPVDISLCLPRSRPPVPAALLGDPHWRQVAAIGEAWQVDAGLLARHVKQLWLEFDAPRGMSEMPTPAFGYAMTPGMETRERLLELAQSVFPASFPPPLFAALERLQRLTPPEVWIKHLGRMGRRGGDSLRVILARFPREKIIGFLASLGWRDEGGRLLRTLDETASLVDYFTLSLDLLEGIGPRISLECLLERPGVEQHRWRPLLDCLVARGLCLAGKRDALLAWPGFSRRPVAEGYWPENLRVCEAGLDGGTLSVFHRYISLVKFSFAPGQPVEAKAYLSLVHRWLRRGIEQNSR